MAKQTDVQKANSQLIKVLKAKNKANSGGSGNTTSKAKTKTEQLDSQINNYERRLTNATGKTDVADTRNPLEKALNLKEDQNFLFDIFEIINRPQQAIFGAIDSAQYGDSAWDGMMDGLTGKKETSGGQLLRQAGIGDDESFGLDDVLGFGADIFLDPMDLIGIGIAGDVAKVVGKNAKAVSKVDDLAKAGKIFDKTQEAIKDSRLIGSILQDGGKVFDEAGNAISSISPKLAKTLATGKDTASPLEMLVKGGVQGGKKALGLTDNLIEKGLGKLGNQVVDGASHVSGLDLYKGLKDSTQKTFNATKNIPSNLQNMARKLKGTGSFSKEVTGKQIDNILTNIANKASEAGYEGNILDDILNLENMKGTQGHKTIKGKVIVDELMTKAGIPVNKLSKAEFKELKDGLTDALYSVMYEGTMTADMHKLGKAPIAILDTFFVEAQNGDTLLRLPDHMSGLQDDLRQSILKSGAIDSLLDKDFSNPFYKAMDDLDVTELTNKIASNEFGQAYLNGGESLMEQIKPIISQGLGDADSFQKAGYVRRSMSQDYQDFINKNKSYNKYDLANSIQSGKTYDTLSANKSTEFMTSSDLNNYYRDYGDIITKNLPDKQKEEMLQLIDKGIVEESMQKNVSDFVNDYIDNKVEGNLLNEALVKPYSHSFTEMNNQMGQYQTLVRRLNNTVDDVARLDLQNQIDALTKTIDKEMETSLIRPLSMKVDGKNPRGYTTVDTKTLRNQLNKVKTYTGEANSEALLEMEKALRGNVFKDGMYVDERFANMIGLVTQEPKATNAVFDGMLQVFDKVNSIFKANKLLSPAYNVRNIMGGVTNMALSGVPVKEIPSLMTKAMKTDKLAREGMDALAKGLTLTSAQDDAVKLYQRFMSYGFGEDSAKAVRDVSEFFNTNKAYKNNPLGKGQKAIDTITNLNARANIRVDNWTRLATMEYFEKHPEKIAQLGFDNAGDVVRWAMFDPSDLSKTEQDVIKKIVPFYTFTKKNLAYQFSNSIKNTDKYYKLQKGIDSLWATMGVDTALLADYQRDGTQIPIYKDADGNIKTIKANLPSGDLFDMLTDPMQKITAMMSPIIKAPIEATTGVNSFTGREIESYEGEQSQTIPFMTKKQEWASGLLGLDVPLRSVSGAVGLITNEDKGKAFQQAMNLTADTTIEKMRNNKQYQQLENLKAHVARLEAKGIDVETIAELENKNKNISAIQAQLNSLLGK